MRYLALDLETTGFDPERDRVIEVGAVAFDEAGVETRLERLTDPGRAVPDAVLRLTGIDPADLVLAPPPDAPLRELAVLLQGRTAVGHGARLDVDFLTAAGIWPPGEEILDTLDLARILLPDAPSHSLQGLVAWFGLRQPRPHRALDDADATRQLLLHLRQVAAGFRDEVKRSLIDLVAPYVWPLARFLAESLTLPERSLPVQP
ncbi:MAG: 3'-5' exonuclease, partial [Candidatus Dormibacteraeota bacterium]|nr:3'-5' exonuclease [Candidatus Dormibacteraeota bacterium]